MTDASDGSVDTDAEPPVYADSVEFLLRRLWGFAGRMTVKNATGCLEPILGCQFEFAAWTEDFDGGNAEALGVL